MLHTVVVIVVTFFPAIDGHNIYTHIGSIQAQYYGGKMLGRPAREVEGSCFSTSQYGMQTAAGGLQV